MTFAITPADLSAELPLFPLHGGLLLPRGELPLNVFEERYMAMVRAALGTRARLIGVVQPKDDDSAPDSLFSVGCAGRINSFHATDDGRYLITLTGIARFRMAEERPQREGFRVAAADFSPFLHDLEPVPDLALDRIRLMILLKSYFHAEGLSCSWDHVKNVSDDVLITALSMVCPFHSAEKQALLEVPCPARRAQIFMDFLEQAVLKQKESESPVEFNQCH